MCVKQVLIWLEVRKDFDNAFVSTITVHDRSLGEERHTIPSWTDFVPSILDYMWTHSLHADESTFFELQQCSSVGLRTFRIDADWVERLIFLNCVLSVDDLLDLMVPILRCASSSDEYAVSEPNHGV